MTNPQCTSEQYFLVATFPKFLFSKKNLMEWGGGYPKGCSSPITYKAPVSPAILDLIL